MKRISAIYARQSVDRADSISIESQIEFCKYELKGGSFKEYKDKGYSGKNTVRPQLQQLLTDIRRGEVEKVITVLSIIFSVILFKYGMDKVITQLQNGKRTFVLNWPEWIFWSFVPIGAGCMILHFIEFCLDFCCKTDSAKNTDNSTKSNMNTITTDKKEGK